AVTALAGRVAALAEGVAALAGRIAAIEAGHAGRVAALDRAAEMRAVAAVAPAGVALPAAFAPLRGREAQALEALLAAVAEAHGVAPADLRGVRRRRPLVRARQAFFAAALEADRVRAGLTAADDRRKLRL
ncbi:MAG TPA: hypothetical protein PKC84_19005, partial [Paracoccaceae bacterium]|nr:hypothetical protein [Paracoccaceae bacterium]